MLLDGLDGRIARMTNTTSDFGRELDSLADIISFGIAPALLAYAWGVQFVDVERGSRPWWIICIAPASSSSSCFCFAARPAWRASIFKRTRCPRIQAARTASISWACRFPSAAAAVAAVVYFFDSEPITSWQLSVAWIATLALLGFLMVSTWRYYSFKDINLRSPRSPLIVVILGWLIILIWIYSQIVLLLMAMAYVMSGIVIRVLGILRRLRPSVRKSGGQLA